MATKEELQEQIQELAAQYAAKIDFLANAIVAETTQVRNAISQLEAKIAQLQNEPGVPVDYSVDLSALKASLGRLDGLVETVNEIVPDPVVAPPVTDAPVE